MHPDPASWRFLSPEARAKLPLARQLALYLDPFAFFADASRGPAVARARALEHNRALRGVLIAYLRRWAMLAGVLFLSAQAAAYEVPSAAFAAGFCIAFVVTAVTAAAYILLGSHGIDNRRL